ncbi:thioredoxin domain-containing protein [Robiginitalea sp. IMCC43444]|uniref:thioredoxin domain-containing protein n=1 Tax=Robiginitalea sp. IMCC43444 TaxID=3459121 RepID=UPI0040438290
MNTREPNNLIHESSPYLLQHAHNPVRWEAWNEQTLQAARESGKLMIISIGYAACHWCHVMEHECFEDPEVAEVMNTRFIPVKVDREERPDVDQIYMDALQIMTGSGGWPLNIVALPDGRPFWGATYVRKPDWIRVLSQLSRLYREDPDKIREYADDLTGALHRINEIVPGQASGPDLDRQRLSGMIQDWKPRFDPQYGGNRGAPKFMMPVSMELLLHWGFKTGDEQIISHTRRTLDAMSAGGLYDQIGGGFSRYSVDERWHIPHFEKMLYDNAQLLSLYSRAYAAFNNDDYKNVVRHTLAFLERELKSEAGGYQASLDADSLNVNGVSEEGAFYVWTVAELKSILKKDFDWFSDYYNLNSKGLWEEEKYVLCRSLTEKEVATAHQMTLEEFRERVQITRGKLLEIRNQRPRPGLDHKIITSWNGLLLSGLADSYRYCGLHESLEAATTLAEFIRSGLSSPDGGLYHTMPGTTASINGFLEDYATVIQGYIDLYEAGQDLRFMEAARELLEFCLDHFSDGESPLLYFVSDFDEPLIRRSKEVNDNVIPASNSIMGKNLFRLGLFFGKESYIVQAEKMLSAMTPAIEKYSSQYSNWMQLALWLTEDFSEVVITGPEASDYLEAMFRHYLPNTLFAASPQASDLPLFRNRYTADQTRIFICKKGHCLHPLNSPDKALSVLQKTFKT